MQTFVDCLCYYNNLDVTQGLGALEKMGAFYTEKGIDNLKDAVNIPGVSSHYLLRGAVERGAELYCLCKKAYEVLKGDVVGGPSIVFRTYHEVGVTRIRDHQIENPRLCKNILGYDSNALYLSTMLRDMSCGKERVVHYIGQWKQRAVGLLVQRLKDGTWFGFAEVDIEIRMPSWQKLAEMCLFFYNKEVPVEVVPKQMTDYLQRTGRTRGNEKKLVGALSAEKLLVYAPLLRWYVDHGALIKAVHRTLDDQAGKIFPWFVEQVTEAGRTGDVEKSKALLTEVFKLLGNSGYGKLIEAVERQTNMIYTKDE